MSCSILVSTLILFSFKGVQIDEDKFNTKERHPSFVGKVFNEGTVGTSYASARV